MNPINFFPNCFSTCLPCGYTKRSLDGSSPTFHEFSVTENLRPSAFKKKDLSKLNGESDVTKPLLIPANNRTVSMPYKVIKGDCNGDDDFSDLNLFGRSCASPIGSVKEPSPIMTACIRNSPVIK